MSTFVRDNYVDKHRSGGAGAVMDLVLKVEDFSLWSK